MLVPEHLDGRQEHVEVLHEVFGYLVASFAHLEDDGQGPDADFVVKGAEVVLHGQQEATRLFHEGLDWQAGYEVLQSLVGEEHLWVSLFLQAGHEDREEPIEIYLLEVFGKPMNGYVGAVALGILMFFSFELHFARQRALVVQLREDRWRKVGLRVEYAGRRRLPSSVQRSHERLGGSANIEGPDAWNLLKFSRGLDEVLLLWERPG